MEVKIAVPDRLAMLSGGRSHAMCYPFPHRGWYDLDDHRLSAIPVLRDALSFGLRPSSIRTHAADRHPFSAFRNPTINR
jgi:hypothetical protein